MVETITLKRQLECTAAPQALWSALADTSRLHRALGQVPLTYRPLKGQPESAARFEMYSERAWGGLAFWELPAEWRTLERLVLRREYPRGPFRTLETRFALSPLLQGTRLAIELVLTPRSPALRLLLRLYGEISMRQLLSAVTRIDADLARGGGLLRRVTALSEPMLTSGASAARGALSEFERPLFDRLIEHLAGLDDLDDDALSPYALATAWEVSRPALVAACLAAAAHDLLVLYWDVICPICLRAAARFRSLSALPDGVTCALCDVPVAVDLERSVEARFSLHPRLRPQGVAQGGDKGTAYAALGPAETPHIIAQIILPATAQAELRAPTEPGECQLVVRGGLSARLNVSTLGPQTSAVTVAADRIQPDRIEVAMGGTLQITHEHTGPRHLSVMRASGDGRPVATPAHAVLLHPLFRRLLVDAQEASTGTRQTLAPGRLWNVPSVALLQTDLVGQLELLRQLGDREAFALIEEHFALLRAQIEGRPAGGLAVGGERTCGAVVRCDRDGVVAAYADAVMAAWAAVELQGAFAKLRARHGLAAASDASASMATAPVLAGAAVTAVAAPFSATLGLRVGVYGGSAQLVTPQGSHVLDYFGKTAGVCSRLLREAHAGDVVLPAELADQLTARLQAARDGGVDAVPTLRVGPRFALSIRGVDAPVSVVRVQVD